MTFDTLIYEVSEGVATITFNRPDVPPPCRISAACTC